MWWPRWFTPATANFGRTLGPAYCGWSTTSMSPGVWYWTGGTHSQPTGTGKVTGRRTVFSSHVAPTTAISVFSTLSWRPSRCSVLWATSMERCSCFQLPATMAMSSTKATWKIPSFSSSFCKIE